MNTNVIELLQDLIKIPSVNPDNSPGTSHTGEKKLALHIANLLANLSADVVLEDVAHDRPNLIARFTPIDDRPRIFFGPHLDTVGVDGMTIDPFAATISDHKIWGRGASDTKGPMAAMLAALIQHHKILHDLPVAIDFVAFCGEESGQIGSKDFAQRHSHAYQFALVGEPTNLEIVHSSKGSLWATLETTGTAGHSSRPECGDNAIVKLIRALNQFEQDLVANLTTFTHPVLGHSTMNIGVIHGGSRPNVIPDHASCEIDIRITPSLAHAGGALKLIQHTIEKLKLPLTISKFHENPPMETPASNPYIQRLSQLGAKTTGAPWFSDAAHLAKAGIPSICIGPGSIDQAHTANEFITIDDLLKGHQFFNSFIQSFIC